MRHGTFFRHTAQQQDGLGQHQFGHRAGVGKRRVEHGDPFFTGSNQVHLVGANAKAAYGGQFMGMGKHVSRQLGTGANAYKMRVGHFGQQLIAFQRAGQAFDVGVARRVQHLDGRRVNAFEQQELDLVFVSGGFGRVVKHGQLCTAK